MSSEKKTQDEIKQILIAVFICFFFSGCAGLIYEILWTRMLTLIFGSTAFATSTVLSAFMGGLALGSLVFGKIADRIKRPLRGYSLLEIGTGLYALVTPFLFKIVQPLYLSVARNWQFSFAYNIFLFFLCLILLITPTTMMGGTLPLMSRFFIKRAESVGKLVGFLYAINTFGAVIGILMAGYFLLPIMGVHRLILIAAVLNIGIGALCFIFDQHLILLTKKEREERDLDTKQPSKISYAGWIILLGFGLSGFTSMVYEVAWTRSLALSIGSSIYAFSTMLVAFIFGIAAGSLLFSLIWGEKRVPYQFFGFIETGIGISVLLLMPLFDRLPTYFVRLYQLFPNNYGFLQAIQFLLCFLVMIIPALLFGASFPIVTRILVDDLNILGNRIGQAYSINTLGCIIGSALTGFFLLPLIGAQSAIQTAVLLNILVAIVVIFTSHQLRLRAKFIFNGMVVIIGLLLIIQGKKWNKMVMNAGISFRPWKYLSMQKVITMEEFLQSRKLLYYREGINCNVAVIKTENHIALNINGKTDASSASDMITQVLSGYLPMILHPDPKDVFILGLGSGVTMGACVNYGAPNVECAEIEEAVIEGAKFFHKENHNVVNNQRDKIITADGRNYLLATPKKYDVISTEPSNPWMAGIANLFSREFYQICARKLKKDGLICQWLQGYSLSPADFQMVIKTFQSVFPYVTIWSTGRTADYLLIGSFKEINLNLEQIDQKIKRPGIYADLKSVNIENVYSLLSCLVLNSKDVREFVKDGMINSDDLPILEFSAPRSLYAETSLLNDQYIRSYQKTLFDNLLPEQRALIRYYDGKYFLLAGITNQAEMEFNNALALDSTLAQAYLGRGIIYRNNNLIFLALEDFNRALNLDPENAEIVYALAKTYELQNKRYEAINLYHRAIRLAPTNINYRCDLINVLIENNLHSEAIAECYQSLAIDSLNSTIYEKLGYCHFILGDTSKAIKSLTRSVELNESNIDALYKLGTIYAATKNNLKASFYLKKALILNPLRVDIRINLGGVYANLGQKKDAANEFKKVLLLDPENFIAFYNLNFLLNL